ncbi:helix-turn-helix domain-containing protein [Microbacterium sp. LMC-P-041]|uniref:helix-turn-helix domain-containing protein n=1 Tax=Microbacterium sp. LMC-P-041 TaxID=3040293 RepID=UPI00255601CD|nr:helix-turn-helix domain-containing protein [Microbacterium sp. LMC-P-041]
MTAAHDPWAGAVLDAVPHPLLIIDARGGIDQINSAATALLGYADRREILGRASHEALHAWHEDGTRYPAHECPIVRTTSNDPVPRGREVFMGRSGRPIPVAWSVSSLPGSRHKLLAFDASFRQVAISGSPARALPSLDVVRGQISDGFRDPALTPSRIADMNHVSLRTLQIILAREGTSPARLIRSERLRYAAQLLGRGMPPRTAAFDSGFSDADTFSRAFRKHFGIAPSAYSIRNDRWNRRGLVDG